MQERVLGKCNEERAPQNPAAPSPFLPDFTTHRLGGTQRECERRGEICPLGTRPTGPA